MNKQQLEMQLRRAKIKKFVVDKCQENGGVEQKQLLAWIQLNFSVSDRKAKEDLTLFLDAGTFQIKNDLISIPGFWPEEVNKPKFEENEKLKY